MLNNQPLKNVNFYYKKSSYLEMKVVYFLIHAIIMRNNGFILEISVVI